MVYNETQGSKKMYGNKETHSSAKEIRVPEKLIKEKAARMKRIKGTSGHKPKLGPPTPLYELKAGRRYDVRDHSKSVWSAEYIGYETIRQLILYCFMQDGQLYKFSEVALIQSGTVREAEDPKEDEPERGSYELATAV